ncbi:MAG TPA: LuxR C-terminal-related transcriptional regulator [Candidatus Methylomirabilis sp.]|jgi:DNA-binding CsgD family transcriptional regulator
MNEAKAPSLSTRQARALALLAQGWSLKEIGLCLKVAPRIVLLYIMHLQRYLGTRTPGDLTRILMEARLLPVKWARAQPRPHPRRARRATPPAVPAGPPRREPGGDGPA